MHIVDMSDAEASEQLHVIVHYAAYYAESLDCWLDGTCWDAEMPS